MTLEYILVLGFALFSIGVAGVVASRHFVIMVLSIEVILVSSSMIAISAYSYLSGGDILSLIFVIWAIAALDVIALVVFYRYLAKMKVSLDVTRLNRLREK
jgi:NADH:ubiquinone oxidoreductase subunit K